MVATLEDMLQDASSWSRFVLRSTDREFNTAIPQQYKQIVRQEVGKSFDTDFYN